MGLRFLRIAVVVGLPVFMLGLGFWLTGSEWAVPLVTGGAIAVLLGLVLFAANVLLNAKPTQVAA